MTNKKELEFHRPQRNEIRKIYIVNKQSPGDVLMLTSAIRDLVRAYGDKVQVNVNTTALDVWKNNPYLTVDLMPCEADDFMFARYDLINKSNSMPYHFIHGFRKDLEKKLNLNIPAGNFAVDIHLSVEEKTKSSLLQEITGEDLTYWLIVSGGKKDFTAKWWDRQRWQEVVDCLRGRVLFVQVGENGHYHPPLQNVIDLRGKTTVRELIRLMYHSSGVMCGVTFLMHLSTMIGRKDKIIKKRPCIVVAGGREPAHWEAYTNHQFLHTCGMLDCCSEGGCWKSRVEKLNDDNERDISLCLYPTRVDSGQVIPRCMDMISVDDVVSSFEKYEVGYNKHGFDFKNDLFDVDLFLKLNPEYNGAVNGNAENGCKYFENKTSLNHGE